MLSSVNKQLVERQTSDSQLSYLELTLNTQWVTALAAPLITVKFIVVVSCRLLLSHQEIGHCLPCLAKHNYL
jgi:hypothetical protein